MNTTTPGLQRHPRALAGLAVTLWLVAGCQAGSSGLAPGGPLQVVATTSLIGEWAARIGGDDANVYTIVGPGVDSHTFAARPADGVALADAAIVLENGLGFEPWLDGLYVASGSQAPRIVASAGVTPLSAGEHAAEEADVTDHEHEAGTTESAPSATGAHDQGSLDAHVWHDVANAERMVVAVRDALAAADPVHAGAYHANAETYLADLAGLDAWVVEQVATVPVERRVLVTSHDTFAYFARRYGFRLVGSALGSVTTEAADPSAGELAALVAAIRAAGVPAIFAENVQNPQLMERIATEAGVALGPALYTDALGPPGSPGESYAGMIRHNVTSIVTALSP